MEPYDNRITNTLGSTYDGPSFYDIKAINTHYCSGELNILIRKLEKKEIVDACSSSATVCENSGYPHPRDCNKCICPSGFTGTRCEDVETGYRKTTVIQLFFSTSSLLLAVICGGSLIATEEWQNISSPGYPDVHPEGQQCTWLLTVRLLSDMSWSCC